MLFRDYLVNYTKLKLSSVEKYTSAIDTISEEMINRGVINTYLSQIRNLEAYENSRRLILMDDFFISKNRRGNNMYSCALEHYYEYLKLCESKK